MPSTIETVVQPVWAQQSTEHFDLFHEPSSYAADVVVDIAARAEAAFVRCSEWFASDSPSPRISIYLTSVEPGEAAGEVVVASGRLDVSQRTAWLAHRVAGLSGEDRLILSQAARIMQEMSGK